MSRLKSVNSFITKKSNNSMSLHNQADRNKWFFNMPTTCIIKVLMPEKMQIEWQEIPHHRQQTSPSHHEDERHKTEQITYPVLKQIPAHTMGATKTYRRTTTFEPTEDTTTDGLRWKSLTQKISLHKT